MIHHRGFGFHADDCAPGILESLQRIRERNGLVVELGCGSGLLTRHLLDAGHRVVATDASPSMLDIARTEVGDAEEIRRLTLPDDSIPAADAIVSVGHVLNYLDDQDAIERALISIARALRTGGVLAIDLCDFEWANARRETVTKAFVRDDWVLVTETSVPSPDRFVRQMTTFVRNEDASWRRDHERHDNVMIDTSLVPGLLARHGVDATVAPRFGSEELPAGLRAVVGRRRDGTNASEV